MIAQRPPGSAPVVQASAEALPFDDGSFDAVMALLTVHHWHDLDAGIAQMRRVARDRIVLLTLEVDAVARVWMCEYFPEAVEIDRRVLPSIDTLTAKLGGASVSVLPVPAQCEDGFTLALWDRPELLLDPEVRRFSSVWHLMRPAAIDQGVQRLRGDLASGQWDEQYGHLRHARELDVGLRLILSERR